MLELLLYNALVLRKLKTQPLPGIKHPHLRSLGGHKSLCSLSTWHSSLHCKCHLIKRYSLSPFRTSPCLGISFVCFLRKYIPNSSQLKRSCHQCSEEHIRVSHLARVYYSTSNHLSSFIATLGIFNILNVSKHGFLYIFLACNVC